VELICFRPLGHAGQRIFKHSGKIPEDKCLNSLLRTEASSDAHVLDYCRNIIMSRGFMGVDILQLFSQLRGKGYWSQQYGYLMHAL